MLYENCSLGNAQQIKKALFTLDVILIVAMSATWSTSCTVALYVSPLVSLTRTPLLLATTWALVTIRPSLVMMKPEPFDTGASLPENGCLYKKWTVKHVTSGDQMKINIWVIHP